MRPLGFDARLDFDDCFSVGAMPCADMGHIVHKCTNVCTQWLLHFLVYAEISSV